MSNLTTLPKGDSAWLFRNAIERIIQQISDLETNIGSSTTGNSANTQIIFNDNGVLRGDPDLTFNTALNKLVATALESTTSLVVGTSATITGDLTVRTSKLQVTSTGVGIGGASAAYPLEINGGASASTSQFKSSSASVITRFTDGTGETGYVGSGVSLMSGISRTDFGIASNGALVFGLSTGLAMTLNATGLGVGVASPAFKLQVVGTSGSLVDLCGSNVAGLQTLVRIRTATANTNGLLIQGNVSNDEMYINNFYNAALSFGTANTERLRIDSSGNVGIGVTPSAWASNRKALQVGGLAAASLALNGTSNVSEMFFNSFINTSASNVYAVNGRAGLIDFGSGGFGFSIDSGTQTAGAACNFTRAMTLDASGNLLVGKTSAIATAVGVQFQPAGTSYHTLAASTNSDTTLLVYSTGAAAYRFYVGLGGTVYATNTTISAISDARLKENVQDIDVGLGAILALKPRKFDWKAGKGKDIKGDRGFIAQEFEEVFPNLIDEWKDPAPEGEAPYKSVRQDLIPVLVKAIQELTARVQTLETR